MQHRANHQRTISATSGRRRWRAGGVLLGLGLGALAGAQFTSDERAGVQEYWLKAGSIAREVAGAVGAQWAVRQSPEGSVYLLEFYRTFVPGKVPPTLDPVATTPETRAWQDWLDRKYAHDEWAAETVAAERNAADAGLAPPPVRPAPPQPGPPPPAMVRRLGEPPSFVSVVRPVRHTVRFDDGVEISYTDQVAVRRKYAYYRFADGVMSVGRPVSATGEPELKALFAEAGVEPDARAVMAAVSLLEGGFDSVNTYDTGYVSVGFIQFASLAQGAGSLGQVLLAMKSAHPAEFERDFRRYGLDVDAGGVLVAVDPSTREQAVGPGANALIIADKRLIAVFQRAGRVSRPFLLAQIRTAHRMYYPADDRVTLRIGGRAAQVRVGDLVRSQAGLATLADRKVNTGNLGDLERRVQAVIDDRGLKTVDEVARHEYWVVRAMTFRKDYLLAADLTKPRPTEAAANRQGTRAGRAPASQQPSKQRRR